MVRTALFGIAAALGLALPLATPSARAHPPVVYPSITPSYFPPDCRTWQVLYRCGHREPWRVYGTFRQEHGARRAAHELRHDGYQVRVVAAG